MDHFSPDDLRHVFFELYRAGWDAILIGGQAVNVWAARYQLKNAEWDKLRPFTSRDLDYYGGLFEARRAMQILNARGKLNTGMEPSPNAGLLSVTLPGGQSLIVDILTGVYGISSAEVERTAIRLAGTESLTGLTIRVIHPLLLLEGKIAAFHGLPQSDRQDGKHLMILILVLQAWLREQLGKPRAVFRSIERLASDALSPSGLHASMHEIDLLHGIPLDSMQVLPQYTMFFQERWPQLLARIGEKRIRHRDSLRGLDS